MARVLLVVLLIVSATLAAQQGLSIDPARMTEHVKVLASDDFEGRAPATPGEEKTVAYIVKQLQALGVRPGGAPDGRGGRSWTQDVPLAQADAVEPVAVSIGTSGASRPLRQGDDIAIRATHLPVARVTVTDAPLVFVGFGVSAPERRWDDFKGVDLRGKIGLVLINDPDFEADLRGRFDGKAMTYYGRWTYKFEEAARRGALGMLVVHETAPASYGWATVRNSNTNTMVDIVRTDPAAVHPQVEGWIQREIASELFKSAGLDFEAEKKKAQRDDFKPVTLANVTFSLDYQVKQSRVVSKNVVGRLEGRSHPDETVMYTAHWDHLGVGAPDGRGDRIYNGARDNALGIASLLEIARLWTAAPPSGEGIARVRVLRAAAALPAREDRGGLQHGRRQHVGAVERCRHRRRGEDQSPARPGDGGAAERAGVFARPASRGGLVLPLGSFSVREGGGTGDLVPQRREPGEGWRGRRQGCERRVQREAVSPAGRRVVSGLGPDGRRARH
jgi:hypothetical protein